MNELEKSANAATLVLGVSSVGKSTFIDRATRQGGLPSSVPVVFAHTLTDQSTPLPENAIIHYNMLNPYQNNADHFSRRIESEPAIMRVITTVPTLKTTVLVAKKSTLMKRILTRKHIEHFHSGASRYPSALIFDFVCRRDLVEIYGRWFSFLEQHCIPYDILSTEESSYNPIESAEAAIELLRSSDTTPLSETEAISALENFSFDYQSFAGLEGASPGAADRSPTFRAISPYIEGPSILDIGCGEGFFSFSLERAGYGPIVGTEIKKTRFLTASAIKVATGSRCEFKLLDVFDGTFNDMHDTVLMLNVLHHLRDPISALKRAAKLCRKNLILEFPTLADSKFSATFDGARTYDDAMPLIGVSSLPGQDQTYLFSPEAIRRIYRDHDDLFSWIDFFPSPLSPERRIAVCWK